MKIGEFDYYLPKELIAKYPVVPRHNARLMILNRKDGSIKHDVFINLPDYLEKDDLLVFNNTKVIKARLEGYKPTGGKVEILLTDFMGGKRWKALLGGKKLKEGLLIEIGDDFKVEIIEHVEEATFIVELKGDDIPSLLEKYGKMPIPPYLEREEEPIDREYYQTIFAEEEGAVASPTASLHFSEELMERLKEKGIRFAFITLHVSYGTFKPVKVEEVEKHKVDPEYIKVPESTVELIKKTKDRGKKVIAVGTTVVRALETKPYEAYEGYTDLYIYPSFRFKVIDGMITNFHLPRSSLLILVSAFAGKDFIMKAYREAVKKRYRFYSYGDGMLIL